MAPSSLAHAAEPPSQVVTLPSSHSSAPPRTPSPQPAVSVHFDVQPSQSSLLPSSHASPVSTTPLPQPATNVKLRLHPSAPGGSHSSPQAVFKEPSPQSRPCSIWQDAEQPSQSSAL